jgi:hypothetical protein
MSLPDYMHSFEEDAKKSSDNPNSPPNSISGGSLDKNFVACLPKKQDGSNAAYKIKADKSGWILQPTVIFEVCENGQPRKYKFFAEKVGTDAVDT